MSNLPTDNTNTGDSRNITGTGDLGSNQQIDRLTQEVSQLREMMLQLTTQGYGQGGPVRGERGNRNVRVEVPRQRASQHGIGAGIQPTPDMAARDPGIWEDTRSLEARSGSGEDPSLHEERSEVSRAGKRRSEPLKHDTLKVFKFDGTDYEIWSKAMGFYLEGAGLWDMVIGDDRRPDDPEEYMEWRVVNTKACNVIFSALTREQQKNVVNCDLAADMWRTLGEIYARKSMVNQAHLIQEYEDYRMRRGTSMMKYIADIRSFIGKLRGIGVDYPEKSVVLKLLRGLSDEYVMDRKILFNTPNLGFEEACNRLLSEAMMINHNARGAGGSTSSKGPVMANAAESFNNEGRFKQERKCFICRQGGHLSAACPHKAKPGEAKVYICYSCGSKEHKIADCPTRSTGAAKGGSKGGKAARSNLAEGKEEASS
jgi:hypothetical protein